MNPRAREPRRRRCEVRGTARAVPALIAAALCACRGAVPARTAEVTRAPLAAARAVVGAVEHGDTLYVFEAHALTVSRGGALVGSFPAPAGWAGAAAVPALDGPGTWVVGVGGDGKLWRVSASGDLDPVGASFGLDGAPVRALDAAGKTIAFTLRDGLATTRDGMHLARFALAAAPPAAAGRDRVAVVGADRVEVWDLAAGTGAAYRVPGARAALFLDAARAPRLVVTTAAGALYIESRRGLARVAAPAIAAAAVAGARLWVLAGDPARLALVEDGALVRTAAPAGGRALFGLASGDVLLASGDSIERYAVARGADDPGWTATIAPIFGRVCAKCHLPGGDAGVDLSTAAAWRADRAELAHRVVETRTMPPAGIDLSESDRRALAAWLAQPAPGR